MVPAVHRRRARAECLFEERSRFDAHGVTARFVAMGHRSGPFTVQILVERAAEGDVENLNPTADRENRQPARARGRDERQLCGVAHGIDLAEAGMRRRSVTSGGDVLTTGEHESAYGGEGGAGAISREHRRHGQGDEAGALQCTNICGVQGDTLAAIDQAAWRRYSNGRSRAHEVWGAGPPNKGQRGLFTLAQSTRTPYRFSAVLIPMIVPLAG